MCAVGGGSYTAWILNRAGGRPKREALNQAQNCSQEFLW